MKRSYLDIIENTYSVPRNINVTHTVRNTNVTIIILLYFLLSHTYKQSWFIFPKSPPRPWTCSRDVEGLDSQDLIESRPKAALSTRAR
jgi:hypothetical protein